MSPPARIEIRAARAVSQLLRRLGARPPDGVSVPRTAPVLASEVLELPDSLEAVEAHFRAQGWTDGLPIVPPTEARVATMLAGIDADPDHVVGKIPPLWAEATVEKVAINAVMAGCGPEAMPVLVAALEAMLDPVFNLYGVQATTHPVAPLLIVHGPAAARLGMHAGAGVFGPGNRANATLGRAVRLCLWNLGGARPGQGDMATQGSPAKYTYAIAERVEASPWGPLHASLGFDAGGGRRHRLRRRGAAQRQRPREPEGAEPPHRDRRHRRHPRLERRLVLLAEPAPPRARPGARRHDRGGRLHAAPTCSATCTSTRGCRSTG